MNLKRVTCIYEKARYHIVAYSMVKLFFEKATTKGKYSEIRRSLDNFIEKLANNAGKQMFSLPEESTFDALYDIRLNQFETEFKSNHVAISLIR